jgi:hypothetical protein
LRRFAWGRLQNAEILLPGLNRGVERITAVTAVHYDGGEAITFSVEMGQEEDGRWIAEVTGLPGVLAYYGDNPEHARARAQALAHRVDADSFGQSEAGPTFSAFRSKLHERLAEHTDPTVVDISPANRLASKAADRIAPHASQKEMA